MSIHRYLLFFLLSVSANTQTSQISVAFQDLPLLLAEEGPGQHLIRMRQRLITEQQQEALQWSNPQIYFQHEFVENNDQHETEQQLYLSKNFSMPWHYWSQRSVVQAHTEAAELQARQESKDLLAIVRTAYVRLSLLQNLNERQKEVGRKLSSIKDVVRVQNEEGILSAADARLLHMTLYGLQGDIIDVQNEKGIQEAALKEMLGLGESQNILLTTSFSYFKLPDDFQNSLELDEELTILKSGLTRLQAFEKGITLEKSRIPDHFSVNGGWKKVDPGWEGYTIGLSIPLPVLSWNGAQIEQRKIAREMQLTENRIKRRNMHNKTTNLVALIKGYQEIFDASEGLFSIDLIEQLAAAWHEGTITLAEFLNAIQIYRLGARQNTDQLVAYYRAVFQLEALYDIVLVTF